MGQSETAYFEARAAAARKRVAATSGIVREVHERFVAAYAERIAASRSTPSSTGEQSA